MRTGRALLRPLRAAVRRLDAPWRHLVVASVIGALGAAAVLAFKRALFALEAALVGAAGGHLVAAAERLPPETRTLAPALGALAAGVLLWLVERVRTTPQGAAAHRGGDYIEAVVIGDGRLDLREGTSKAAASMLVVGTGGAVGREGAMVLLSAMLASVFGRAVGAGADLRLIVSCGAAAGLAAAYHAPLAASVFVAEILLGSLALAQFGPVVVAAVIAYAVAVLLGERSVLFPVAAAFAPGAAPALALLAIAVGGGLLGAAFLHWLRLARALFTRLALPLPLAFALGGLAVGLLSLWHPEVWGNGYSEIEQQLTHPAPWRVLASVLVLKLIAIGASTGSGAPGGVFTPTLFAGAAFGALTAAALAGLGATAVPEPAYAAVGMAVLLAATTHAPVMAALMVFEMVGQYAMLPSLLPTCVIATLLSRRLAPLSVYGLRGPGEMGEPRP